MNIAETVAQLYTILNSLTAEERTRVIASTLALFGDNNPTTISATNFAESHKEHTTEVNPSEYFEKKSPKSKIEEIAIAARFLELQGKDIHTRDDLRDTFQIARRFFDGNNFSRDIDNATRKAGFFLPGQNKGQYQLSSYGQKFVDSLPNRESIKSFKSPRRKKVKTKKV